MFGKLKRFLRTFIREKIIQGEDGPFSVWEVNIHKDSFNEMPVNEHGYVQFTMHRKKTPGEKGDTHYMTLRESRPRQENSDRNYDPENPPMGHVSFKNA